MKHKDNTEEQMNTDFYLCKTIASVIYVLLILSS